MVRLGEVLYANHGGDLLPGVEPEEAGDGLALGGAGALGDVVDLFGEALAGAGEVEHVVVRRGGEEGFDEILLVGLGADDALAAALLGAVGGDGRALDEAEVRDGDDAALVGDDVLHAQLTGVVDDLGAAGRGVFVAELDEFRLDQREQPGLVGEDVAELEDEFFQRHVFGLDLAALQAGELVEAELEDGVGLDLGERILRHQLHLGLVAVGRGADDLHEVVEVIEGDDVAFEDVGAGLGLGEAELGAARDHVAAVVDVALEEFLDVHLLRPLLVEGQQDDAEGGLEGGLLVKLVDDDLRLLAALELDDDARVLVGLVAEVADAVDFLFADEIGDAQHERVAVHVVGDLGDDDLLAAALELLGVGLAAHADDAAAGGEVGLDARAAVDVAAGREIRAGDVGDQLVEGDAGPVDDGTGGVDDLGEVVRRDVGRHADSDAGRAVHQQIRQRGGQDGRLSGRLLVIGDEVDGVLLDVLEQFLGDVLQAGLSVTVGGRRIAVDRAEVALRVDELVAHDPVLGEAHEGVVNRRVAVRVVVLEHFTDDAGALVERAVVHEALAQHRVEDAALDGLQAVAGVGQGARDDDRHRILDVGRLHDVGDVGRRKFFVGGIHRGKARGGREEARKVGPIRRPDTGR